ncbi:hypothetical protein DTO166G4_4402 [Paecilomyces variotii]|nr:hypothetical protein DTO166G4_4402 [Paecilomyces variotii]KAJ9231438.1 hypothetical protein DTO166G5_6770 [Paecilomyces variotii]KAJ9303987.1 hypothetical protein DTO217A2_6520 [Paecilomyces variotii]
MGSLDDVKERPIQHTIQRSAPLGGRDGIKSKKEHRCDLEVERYRYLVMAGSGQGTGRNQRYDAGDVGTGRAWSRALGQVPVAWLLGGEVPARVETTGRYASVWRRYSRHDARFRHVQSDSCRAGALTGRSRALRNWNQPVATRLSALMVAARLASSPSEKLQRGSWSQTRRAAVVSLTTVKFSNR